jgi:hypothetical protein
MPFFECPKCEKLDLVPLAVCEWMLATLPAPRFDTDNNPVYSRKCPACRVITVEVIEGDLLDQ